MFALDFTFNGKMSENIYATKYNIPLLRKHGRAKLHAHWPKIIQLGFESISKTLFLKGSDK